MAQPLEYENLGYNPTLGSIYGKTSTDKIGFYGTIPVTRPITISTAQVSTVVGRSTSSAAVVITTWGFATQVEIENAITAVSTIQWTMKALGLIAGGVQDPFTRSSMPFQVVDYGSPDGAQFGKAATDLISFYGASPTARAVSSANISTATTVSASTNGCATTTWGWTTSSEFAMYCNAISTMQIAMKNLGLMV
jgi:hypothetical protein